MEIIPAIMPSSYADLEEKAHKVAGLVSWAQIDVMDGKFVPSMGWPYTEPNFSFLGNETAYRLPLRGTVQYEVDLMVQEPMNTVDFWVRVGVSRTIFHVESVLEPATFVQEIQAMYGAGSSREIIEVGIAIGVETPNDVLEDCVYDVDFVQFMGIARIGYQGEKFDERVLGKIAALRTKHPETIISVDGGVSLVTAPQLIAAGATRLAVGSAIFMAEDIPEAIKKFQNM